MPDHIECDECGLKLMAFRSRGPKPIGTEACARCGATEFTFVGE